MKRITALILVVLSLALACSKPASIQSNKEDPKKQDKTTQVKNKLHSFKEEKTGLYGFKNEKGDVVLPPQFNTVSEPSDDEDLIAVTIENKFYRMDKTGNLKFESFLYDNAWDYYEQGLARFVGGNKIGFHDKKGNIVIPANYDFAFPFADGISIVCNGCIKVNEPDEEHSTMKGGKWGAIDLNGKVVVPIESLTREDAASKIKAKN